MFIHDPDATLDYTVDWTDWLAGDVIINSSWSAPADISILRHERTQTIATVWISGGQPGRIYRLTNRITTRHGRTDERSIRIIVRER